MKASYGVASQMEIDDETGAYLVRLARDVVERFLTEGKLVSPPKESHSTLNGNSGAFVTINGISNGGKELRGCIGFPYPDKPIIEAVTSAAIAAAIDDPRFPPLTKNELDRIVFEVSVLTPPELIRTESPKELPKYISIGKDGLIVKWVFGSGLLLPQVPIEYKWDAEEFLGNACMKAGATPDMWLVPSIKVYKFQATVFEEVTPRGEVSRKHL